MRSSMKRIYLVRHGETEANNLKYVPSKEEPLNDAGFMQAAKLAERISNLKVDSLIVSDYLRTHQTVKPLAEQKKMEPQVNAAFGEMFEPTSIHNVLDTDERVSTYRENRNKNIENSDWRFEDGETFIDMQVRVNAARDYLTSLETESVLVVSHTFFLRFLVASILLDTRETSKSLFQIATTLNLNNTGISYLTYDENKWKVMLVNDHAHFAE